MSHFCHLREDGTQWRARARLDKNALMPMWRYAVITLLREAARVGVLDTDLSRRALRELLTAQYERWWNIDIKRFKSKKQFLGYAGRYARTMAPSGLVLNAVRRVGRHQYGPSAVKHPLNISGCGGVPAQEPVLAQDEQVAARDVRRRRFDGHIVVGQSTSRVVKEGRELPVGPERGQIEAALPQLLEHVDIPFEIQFADPVVGDGQGTCAGITTEVEVLPLDRDQMLAVGLDDMQWKIQAAGLLDGLVPSNDDAMSIDKHGTAGTVGFEGPCQRGDAARGTEVGVAWVGAKVCDVLNGRWAFLF